MREMLLLIVFVLVFQLGILANIRNMIADLMDLFERPWEDDNEL